MNSEVRCAWLRLALMDAERAIDFPYNRAASLWIDSIVIELEAA